MLNRTHNATNYIQLIIPVVLISRELWCVFHADGDVHPHLDRTPSGDKHHEGVEGARDKKERTRLGPSRGVVFARARSEVGPGEIICVLDLRGKYF